MHLRSDLPDSLNKKTGPKNINIPLKGNTGRLSLQMPLLPQAAKIQPFRGGQPEEATEAMAHAEEITEAFKLIAIICITLGI